MKSQLAAVFAAIVLFAGMEQTRADFLAPKGCHFEVQVRYIGALHHPRGTIRYSYWELFGDKSQSMDEAWELYDFLQSAHSAKKLPQLLGLASSYRKYPVEVRLVMICKSDNVFQPDDMIVITTTETSR